jgi:hypothetical protein
MASLSSMAPHTPHRAMASSAVLHGMLSLFTARFESASNMMFARLGNSKKQKQKKSSIIWQQF